MGRESPRTPNSKPQNTPTMWYPHMVDRARHQYHHHQWAMLHLQPLGNAYPLSLTRAGGTLAWTSSSARVGLPQPRSMHHGSNSYSRFRNTSCVTDTVSSEGRSIQPYPFVFWMREDTRRIHEDTIGIPRYTRLKQFCVKTSLLLRGIHPGPDTWMRTESTRYMGGRSRSVFEKPIHSGTATVTDVVSRTDASQRSSSRRARSKTDRWRTRSVTRDRTSRRLLTSNTSIIYRTYSMGRALAAKGASATVEGGSRPGWRVQRDTAPSLPLLDGGQGSACVGPYLCFRRLSATPKTQNTGRRRKQQNTKTQNTDQRLRQKTQKHCVFARSVLTKVNVTVNSNGQMVG